MATIVVPTPPEIESSPNSSGNVATFRYAHQVAPWDAPLSLGVQAFIDYNSYTINDRHQADRIRVMSITGLDGPDITDSRESVPGDIGEFVYDTTLRGRTFLISGEIQAGSLGVLKRLERDLRVAYAIGVEAPMKFRWFDIYDSFDDPQTIQNYTPMWGVAGVPSLFVSGGVIRWATTQDILLSRSADNRLWGDAQTTVRIVGPHSGASKVYIVPKLQTTGDFVKVAYDASGPALTISAVAGGTSHQLSSVSVSGMVQGQSIWLRAKMEGDLVTAELWTTPPAETTLPAFTTIAWLTGSDADNYGDQVLSQIGFGAQTATTDWAFDDFRIETICPCDIAFNVKSIAKPSIKESQDSITRFKRQFQLTLRSGKPYARCATQSRSQILVPASGVTTQLGFGAPLTAPLSARTFVPGTLRPENDILFVQNRGTAPDRPIFVVYGQISNFLIANLINGQQINWTGDLMDGDYLVFDCSQRTLVNSGGIDQKQFLLISDSTWMQFEPDWNDIFITGTNYSANTKLVAYHRGSFI